MTPLTPKIYYPGEEELILDCANIEIVEKHMYRESPNNRRQKNCQKSPNIAVEEILGMAKNCRQKLCNRALEVQHEPHQARLLAVLCGISATLARNWTSLRGPEFVDRGPNC